MSYEDDEAMQRFREAMEYAAKRHEDDVLVAAEESLSQVATDDCPPPLSWHPYYRGKTWLIDWLNGNSSLPEWDIVLPVVQPLSARLIAAEEEFPVGSPSVKVMRMSKQRAWGPAPWVGRPFHYEWFVGKDELGRMCAGESRIVYNTFRPGQGVEW